MSEIANFYFYLLFFFRKVTRELPVKKIDENKGRSVTNITLTTTPSDNSYYVLVEVTESNILLCYSKAKCYGHSYLTFI